MQALVIAHAAFGHNHFFRNNHLFRQWTEPSGDPRLPRVRPHLSSPAARTATASPRSSACWTPRTRCRATACIGTAAPGRSTSRRSRSASASGATTTSGCYDDLWRTVADGASAAPDADPGRRAPPPARPARGEPALFPGEDRRRRLQSWEREIIRIVRLIAQYFYPQPQAKVMNEGCATWVHQRIMTRLHETGQIDDAAFLEVLHSTSNVIMQPGFDHPAGGPGFNPVCARLRHDDRHRAHLRRSRPRRTGPGSPTSPATATRSARCATPGRTTATRASCCSSSRRRSCAQFRMFRLLDDTAEPTLLVDAIHDDAGYRAIRRSLARSPTIPGESDADVQVVDVDLAGDRRLLLQHRTRPGPAAGAAGRRGDAAPRRDAVGLRGEACRKSTRRPRRCWRRIRRGRSKARDAVPGPCWGLRPQTR